MHDVYGIEVSGIKNEEDAVGIRTVVERMLPSWSYRRHFYWERIETGWKVEVHRDLGPHVRGLAHGIVRKKGNVEAEQVPRLDRSRESVNA